MRKTITTETIYEYNEDGQIIRKTITETEDTDDNPQQYLSTWAPYPQYWDYTKTSDHTTATSNVYTATADNNEVEE